MRLHLFLSSALAVGLAACAAEVPDGELPFEGEASSLGKADHATLAFTAVDDATIVSPILEHGGTVILTTPGAWRRVMGTPAPASVDFGREWVAFHGSGLQHTGGFAAEVTGLRYYAGLRALVLETKDTSPGPGCIVTQALTTPHSVVEFAIPWPRPRFALADHTDETRTCGPTNADRLAELEHSLAVWTAARDAAGHSYTYSRDLDSMIGLHARTTFVVEAGVIVERRFEARYPDGTETQWTEVGAEVGSHTDQGFGPVLVDFLYQECRERVLTQDETTNTIQLALDERGFLQACTFTPIGCYDGCTRGPTISSLELAAAN